MRAASAAAFRFPGVLAAVAAAAALLGPAAVLGKESVLSSPHNLSASGRFATKFSEERRVCVFCHAPHNAKSEGALWSHDLSSANYTNYVSPTLKASIAAKPTGASRLCLSCHDGTIALNRFVGSAIVGDRFISTGGTPTTNPNLSVNLADDHPVSFVYDDLLASQQGELAFSPLPAPVSLSPGSVLECTACHDPHNNEYGKFLVMNNSVSGSPLCVVCHKNTGWGDSGHNPANTPALAGACQNCHYVHNAPGAEQLLRSRVEEENCFTSCHNGSDASVNVKPLFNPGMHRHPVDYVYTHGATVGHLENETLPASIYHVECVDCHNPHQAKKAGTPHAAAPYIDGPLAGVRKDNTGQVATREYEVCFRCHAGINAGNFSGISEMKITRVLYEPDQQNRFDNTRTSSYHPVTSPRSGGGGSLIGTLQATMKQIYCTDCHNSDQSVKAGGGGANGPHGSSYEHILLAQYDMPLPSVAHQPYSWGLYKLCYTCHEETYIMGGGTGFRNGAVNEHDRHVKDPARLIPCFACHDPHGVPLAVPAPAFSTRLVNFSKDYASGGGVPNPTYTPSATGGTCVVVCHTVGGTSHTYTR